MTNKPRILHQAMISFGCVLLGWLAMSIFMILRSLEYASISPNWYAMPLTISMYSLPYVVATWLVLVFPVYSLVPCSSRFWFPPIGTLAFAAAGFLIMASITRFSYMVPLYVRLWLLATIVGAVTGICCSLMQRRLKNALNQAEQ
jgi:hypothetical protein